jgi:hypothetical protein
VLELDGLAASLADDAIVGTCSGHDATYRRSESSPRRIYSRAMRSRAVTSP